ncbi:MAG: ferrous iron transport protein B [Bacteroidales bacterium]|nr:ferrous iron transport protein B [Bacteroidales bacterium]MDD2205356.1 ferrous iron transport protein B [Bacteroidales bacterium]MDD3914783.1 ferrous iron transport protein B [Bacteroidales bacterium]MDD4634210.1 ferrous iron transport protein B [Bacteroidales bacterium]
MSELLKTLADVPTKSRCVIVKVHGHGGFRHRILEMGFVKGETITVIKNAPLMDPIEYEIMGSHVSLRRSEAANIEVVPFDEMAENVKSFNGTIEELVANEVDRCSKEITVALVGNPNCGKTSFFNHATGLHEKVGNYGGVTVDYKVGIFHANGYTINLVDLPGTYSLTEYSPEELYVRKYLTEKHPDVILNIVDASNLERNLFLTTQLIDQNPRMVMALNMYDELEASGDKLDYHSLAKMLGFPIVPTISKTGKGLDDVLNNIIKVYEDVSGITKHIHINYGEDVEKSIAAIKVLLEHNESIHDLYHERYIALKLIENDSVMQSEMSTLANYEDIKALATKCRNHIEKSYNDDITSVISDLKYGFIRGALNETLLHSKADKKRLAYALDTVLTNRWLGFPVLLLFLWLMFEATFILGAYPQQWLEFGIEKLGNFVGNIMPAGILNDLVVDGIIAGVGGVLVFLPNILILFLFISILEDTGYMARAAFIMDKLMHRIGLHGKSFIPYLIGFGCSVPAIMATRTLENRKDRILTILTIPFMSCSARLPVYVLFVSAFFDKHKALVLMSLYIIGVIVAALTSLLLNKTVFKNSSDQFVMELPPYRKPIWRNTLLHMWTKTEMYLKKMATVILVASIIIWVLGYFPRPKVEMTASQQAENSYIGRIGHAIEPAVKPLGFDWKMGVSILSGFAAKEIIVSSMGILYDADSQDAANETSLIECLKMQKDEQGNTFFTPLRAYAFLIFVLLYFPCIASLTAIKREAGFKWMTFFVVYTTAVAWIAAFAIFQIGSLF